MLDQIISGGKVGAEQAARRAASRFGISSGGLMPGGISTGVVPPAETSEDRGHGELPAATDQTALNVQAADATLWFGVTTTLGAQQTVGACHRFAKPCMLVYPTASFEPWHVAAWIEETRIETLHVAGNREEEEPGIGERVECFLGKVLEQLGHEPIDLAPER